MYGSYGNLNLGIIQRPGEKKLFLVDRFAPMPDPVEYMHGYIYQASPSLTAIIMCFVLKDEHNNSLEKILEQDRNTRNERGWRSRGYRVIGPYHAKQRDIRTTRQQLHSLVAQWFHKNIPGFFSARDFGARLPTTELLTTRRQQLLRAPRDRTVVPKWVNLVGRMGFLEVWRRPDSEAISLTWDSSESQGQLNTLINLRTELLTEKDLKHYQGKSTGSYVAFVSQHVEGVLVHIGVLAGLIEIQRGLRIARDTFPAASQSSRQSLRAIQRIKSFFSNSLGLPTITSEMLLQSETDHYFRWSCESFTSEPWRDNEKPDEIAAILKSRTNFVAKRAATQERETREHFEQMSAVLNTQEAIRTQRRMEILTAVATLLTAASLLVALLSIESARLLIEDLLNPLFKN